MSAAKILFAGTPDFALASLRALVESGLSPQAVLTQPDRPSGRGRKLTASPVKAFAMENDIEVLQPSSLKDAEVVDDIARRGPDVIVVAAYGLLLPQSVLDIPEYGCVNVHASLLPRWRGAAPIQAAILAGDEKTGISLMRMEAGLDTGPVFASTALTIDADETAGELHDRLAHLGGELLVQCLPRILAGELQVVSQNDAESTYAGKICKEDAVIDWTADAAEVVRKVRAYNPAPGATFRLGDESIKCWRALQLETSEGSAGVVMHAGTDGVDVACGTGVIRLTEIQRPGRRRVSGGEFATQESLVGKTFH